MAKFSKQEYTQMFDSLLSEELYFSSSYASEENIRTAIKRILGRTLKAENILLYSDLWIDESLNVHFSIKDPDGEIIPIVLIYGA